MNQFSKVIKEIPIYSALILGLTYILGFIRSQVPYIKDFGVLPYEQAHYLYAGFLPIIYLLFYSIMAVFLVTSIYHHKKHAKPSINKLLAITVISVVAIFLIEKFFDDNISLYSSAAITFLLFLLHYYYLLVNLIIARDTATCFDAFAKYESVNKELENILVDFQTNYESDFKSHDLNKKITAHRIMRRIESIFSSSDKYDFREPLEEKILRIKSSMNDICGNINDVKGKLKLIEFRFYNNSFLMLGVTIIFFFCFFSLFSVLEHKIYYKPNYFIVESINIENIYDYKKIDIILINNYNIYGYIKNDNDKIPIILNTKNTESIIKEK